MEARPSHTLADKNSNQTGNVSNSADKFGYKYSVTVLTTERCDDVSFKNKLRARQRGQTCIFKNYPEIEIFDISVELKAEKKQMFDHRRSSSDHRADGRHVPMPSLIKHRPGTKDMQCC